MKWKLKWEGDKVLEIADEAIRGVVSDIGLSVEGDSKTELYKGHGVITGTLRRSIHAAPPSHDFSGEGASNPSPEKIDGKWTIAVGSGLTYAMPVHQGHHSFAGYHYITRGVEKTRPKVPEFVAKRALK